MGYSKYVRQLQNRPINRTLNYPNKKDPAKAKSLLVRVVSESLHIIEEEIYRWRKILAVPYQEHLLSK